MSGVNFWSMRCDYRDVDKRRQSYPKTSVPQTGPQPHLGWSMSSIGLSVWWHVEALIKCPSEAALRSEEGCCFKSSLGKKLKK